MLDVQRVWSSASNLQKKGIRQTMPSSPCGADHAVGACPTPTATLIRRRQNPARSNMRGRRIMTLFSNRDGLRRAVPAYFDFPLPLLLVAALAGGLIACSQPDQSDASNAAANMTVPVRMPPAIVASHTYRCVGGDILYVDFLADETSINVKRGPTGRSLRLAAPAQGLAYVGDGMNLTLDGKDIQLDEPKKPSRMCKRA